MFVDIYYKDVKPIYMINELGEILNKNTNKTLKARVNSRGYLQVSLQTINGNTRTILVHRLVAIHFVPNFNPNINIEVNHIDCDKTNPHYSNLEWVTSEYNKHHALINGKQSYKGEDNPSATHSEELVRKICELLEQDMSKHEILHKLSIPNTKANRSFISKIKNGNRWVSISSEYNIPTKAMKRDNFRYREYTIEIKSLMERGFTDGEICKLINWDISTKNERRKKMRFLSSFREKEMT